MTFYPGGLLDDLLFEIQGHAGVVETLPVGSEFLCTVGLHFTEEFHRTARDSLSFPQTFSRIILLRCTQHEFLKTETIKQFLAENPTPLLIML